MLIFKWFTGLLLEVTPTGGWVKTIENRIENFDMSLIPRCTDEHPSRLRLVLLDYLLQIKRQNSDPAESASFRDFVSFESQGMIAKTFFHVWSSFISPEWFMIIQCVDSDHSHVEIREISTWEWSLSTREDDRIAFQGIFRRFDNERLSSQKRRKILRMWRSRIFFGENFSYFICERHKLSQDSKGVLFFFFTFGVDLLISLRFLALVCLMKEESYRNSGLIDYNVSILKKAIASFIDAKEKAEKNKS